MNLSKTQAVSEGTIFRYSADRIPILLFVLYFALDVFVFFAIQNKLLVVAWMLSTLLPKACICAWNHHQQHCSTFHNRLMNRLLETMYGLQTGALPFAWTLHHNLGHHVHYLDQEKDESGWRRKDGQVMGAHEYSFIIFITAYPRILTVARKYPRIRKQFLTWASVTGVILLLMAIYNPFNAAVLFIVPMMSGLYFTAWHTYYHHAGLDTDEATEGSYNILHRPYNLLTGNLGYHTAHHMRMGVHWSKLPKLHNDISDRIPPQLYREPCIPFRWMGKSQHAR